MKFYSFILSCLTFLFLTTPAFAGRLISWRFEANQNRLVFTTDRSVQPTAQLISNPTRLVIDLPGTNLGRGTVNENLGSLITNLRIGQFDNNTTRVVVEIAQGYTIDPQKVRVQGISPTQWSVDIPQPERMTTPPPVTPTPPRNNNSSIDNPPPSNPNNTTARANSRSPFQISSSGILMGIDGNSNNAIRYSRSRDRREIEFELQGITLTNELINSWDVNEYGISSIDVSQKRSSPPVASLKMNVNPDSPDWQASFSRMGGLVLWPQGGMGRVESLSSSNVGTKSVSAITVAQNTTRPVNIARNQDKTIIESINFDNNDLLIRANQSLRATGTWSQQDGTYQIRINNADLSPNFRNPQLSSNSPLSRLRIWQPDDNTVILLVQPSPGVRIGRLNQPNDRSVSLSLLGGRTATNNAPIRNNNPVVNDPTNNTAAIPVNPPPRNISITPPPANTTPPANNRPNQSRPLVIIDPGHGGRDPGAVGIGGLREKDVILPISLEVARILEQQGIQARLTRNNDNFISLEGRTNMANSLNADLFVSIHANAISMSRPDVNGLETYYFQSGRNLANVIHRNILQRLNIRDRRVRQARFYVLRNSRMPSVLVETGFVTGREDAARLGDPNFQRQMAQGIAAGIVEYVRTNRL
ncbi:N-acetylmuramoyl-L-alanine amidase [Cyanobacterium sp. IPPAS B-1200]|uniref:N-acetylmuramoyl-L-alanine amidase n=1 Tax=Cyanobacterium sp. IPPAS B-1200 TaxID=1562720 RepID=UPI0008526902|nr:N-acetylmuramoyl-L-alanine amidase [Cyanobacterium sp. IPPAS B-1200]OEJ78854.1 N-acetylmuramoyl-L-alanine amidase [Cyanobacterium sp. IPPAS B-1200]